MVIVASVLLLCFALVALRRLHRGAVTIEESTQIRGIHQGFVLWRPSNDDSYPSPSGLDKADATIRAADPRAKDTTSNIYSILVFNGFISPEICVSLMESNPDIRACRNYAFSNPPTAANPSLALWDPAFSVDFTNGKIGNASYAHQLPIWRGAPPDRPNVHPRWFSTFQGNEPILASRGPQIASATNGVSTLANPNSFTLGKHGPKGQWQGLVAYNDNHVSLEHSLTPPEVLYRFNEQGQTSPDILFYDEPDSHEGLNAYLGIFPKAGPTAADYVAIWD